MNSRINVQIIELVSLIVFPVTMAAQVPELHKAAAEGNIQAVESLLAQGQNPDSTNSYGLTPLHLATAKGQYDVAKLLIAKGANVNVRDPSGKTPLLYCAITYATKTQEILKGSVSINKDFSSSPHINKLGRVNYLPYKRQFDLAHLLVENSADVNAADTNQATSLMFAAQHGFAELIQFFVDIGAEVNSKNVEGITALHAAVLSNYPAVAELLLANGAEVNDKLGPSLEGRTALILATLNGNLEMVSILLNHDADASIVDLSGKSSLQYAEDDEIRNLLERKVGKE